MKKSFKVSRYEKDKKKRKAPKETYKPSKRIIREAPPKREKKIITQTELVKDTKTGKAKYQETYKVVDVKDPKLDKKLEKTLYIPKMPPEKERTYLRKVLPQFERIEKKYNNPNRYGSLEAYKKNRLLTIAKDDYDLSDKLAKKLDKDDIIRYIKKRYKLGIKLDESKYLPVEVPLRKVEPIRNKPLHFTPSNTPLEPWKSEIQYGSLAVSGKKGGKGAKSGKNLLSGKGTVSKTALEILNEKLSSNPKYASIVPAGEVRPMNKKYYELFIQGKLPRDKIVSELVTHLNIPPENILMMDEKQAQRLYKKAYKQSQLPKEERFKKPIVFPKFKQTNAGNFAKPPIIKDPTGKPHILGTVPIPENIEKFATLNLPYDYQKTYGEPYSDVKARIKADISQYIKQENLKISAINVKKRKLGEPLLEKYTYANLKPDLKEHYISNPQLGSYEKAVQDYIQQNVIQP